MNECDFERNAGGDRVAMEVNKREPLSVLFIYMYAHKERLGKDSVGVPKKIKYLFGINCT